MCASRNVPLHRNQDLPSENICVHVGENGACQLPVGVTSKIEILSPTLALRTGAYTEAAQFTAARLKGRVRRPSRQFIAFCVPKPAAGIVATSTAWYM